jgi:hypothetical protein
LRRETFLVCDKENNGCGMLPRTPAKANISIDSLDASPAAAMAVSSSSWAKNILNQFTMSPLVTNNVFLVNAQQTNFTFSTIDDGIEYDSRRCSTSVKKVPLPDLDKIIGMPLCFQFKLFIEPFPQRPSNWNPI